jgi:ABC-type spermidine/putrescine transport system permease subunit I
MSLATTADDATIRPAPPPARNDSALRYICLAPPVLYFGLLFVGPLIFLIALGFWTVENFQVVPGFSLSNYRDIAANFLAQSNYGYALAQTLYVAATTAIVAVALCYPMALAVVFAVPQRWQRLVLLLCFAPFWTSYILRVFAWQVLLAKRGIINSAFAYIGLPDVHLSILYTQIATRIGLVHYLAPVLIVILYVSISNIDATLLAAASELGASRMQVLRRVILPLSRGGIILSLSFAAIVSCGDVLSGSLLGGGAGQSLLGKLPLFANMVIREYASSTNLPHTAALALILVVTMLLILFAGFAIGERSRVEVK